MALTLKNAIMARASIRASVTKSCNSLDTELKKAPLNEVELAALSSNLEKLTIRLEDADQTVVFKLLEANKSQDDLNNENDDIQEYSMKISRMQVAVKKALAPSINNGNAVLTDKKYKLPKIEMAKFNGEISDWLSWWAQYKKIHEDDKIEASDKFQYLVQSIVRGSKAASAIENFPVTAENYPKVIEVLQGQFGDQKVLWKFYMRELITLVQDNSPTKKSVDLFVMYNKLRSQLRALESLGNVTRDDFLCPLVESSIPAETLVAWQRSPNYGRDGSNQNPPKSELDFLLDFLQTEVQSESLRKMAQGNKSVENKNQVSGRIKKVEDIPTAASLYVNQDSGGCIFCSKKNHSSQDCFKAAKMNLDAKKEKVKESHSCFNCLMKGHVSRKCKTQVHCGLCNQRHYQVMCPSSDKSKEAGIKTSERKENSETVQMTALPIANASVSQLNRKKLPMMMTLLVHVKGHTGKIRKVRLLLDTGAQLSYIKTSIAKKLKCSIIEKCTTRSNLFGGYMTEHKNKNVYKVTLEGILGQGETEVKLMSEDVICQSCTVVETGPWVKELETQNIFLTESWGESEEIEILIGMDLFDCLMTDRVYRLNCGLVARETIFGWTLGGRLNEVVESNCATTLITMLTYEEKCLPKLWDLETIGIMDSAEKISQEEHDISIKKKFQENIVREKDGRYVVSLPWISKDVPLPSNRSVAEKRLESATKKLTSQNEFKRYDNIISEWENEGIVEKFNLEDLRKEHFLPHRPVFKPESLTTPVRPVFDASCRVGKNPSLNQCFEKGPNLLELIPSILLRFREKRIGVLSDIRKAFLMVGVAEEDRNFLKFLWWEDLEKVRMQVYRHCRVVFGMNCSPFILAAVIDHHLNSYIDDDKELVELLKKSLYVDNCVLSFDEEKEYQQFRTRSTAILADAKMDLRQWESNIEMTLDRKVTSVLGLKWNKESDTLQCQVLKNSGEQVITKRNVLSVVSKVFDPIGFTSPALLPPKVMLQSSWGEKLGWDEEWDQQNSEVFKEWQRQLPELGKIEIARNAFGQLPRENIQIHTFCDASKIAYAAVVFARIKCEDQVIIQLLMAKSRLSPLDKKQKKHVTIPRLELLGSLIGSRLAQSVKSAMTYKDVSFYYWSDSSTVIAWIRRDEDWGSFVGYRVREINKLTRQQEWRHVPGQQNPADLPSRGCSPSELVQSKWWEGPTWLKEDEESWPTDELKFDEDAILCERKKSPLVVVTMPVPVLELRFSSYFKNVEVAGWVRRFIENSRKKAGDRYFGRRPSRREMRKGEIDLIYQIQQQHYSTKPKLKNLDVELKEDGLYHVRTRLTYKEDTDLFRSPILLPKEEPLVKQMIQYIHRSNCHAGVQFVLGKLREKFWIMQGRKTVSTIIHECVVCKRHSSKPLLCDPAPLPQDRIETTYAFQTTGVDLAGPLVLKGGVKCWIVLYTDAVYRGVFLDIVDSISSDEFLDSLEKFTCTIGRPNTMYSDNGTNFVGAQRLMKILDWNKLEAKFHVKEIKWSFNPPTAAWWGGWWERMVRMIKELLRKMIGTAKLTRRDLEKCLTSISYTINNRPLTTLTEDEDDLTPLTPAMFMMDLPVSGLPEREEITTKDIQKAYEKVRKLRKSLKERFRKEYLSMLVQKRQEIKSKPPEVGDVVLVGQDNKKRYEWPIARIVELYPGKDEKIRVARVKTASGVLVRPIQRLYPLEISSPKCVEVPSEVIEVAKEKKIAKAITGESELEEVKLVQTRKGRVVRRPSRYGTWNE